MGSLRDVVRRPLAWLLSLTLIPAAAAAQTSGMAGVVRDTTGAVLPGVTVEASSPALIEKFRSVITDGNGLYRILDLRPGVYTVTFSLAGFATIRREGIALTTAFTATVNADLQVGSVQEAVVVTGRSPTVDVRNVVQRSVIESEIINALPSTRSFQAIGQLIPGITPVSSSRQSGQDVGGLAGERARLLIHGGNASDAVAMIDGLSFNVTAGSGSSTGFTVNPGEVQEYSLQLAALAAEYPYGGVNMNLIPKEGGNRFGGSFVGEYTDRNLVSDNLTDELKRQGLTAVNQADLLWDLNLSTGGPLARDRLWFFGSYRYWGQNERVAGMYYNKTPGTFAYTPDLTREQFVAETWLTSASIRLTWQANEKNKFGLYVASQPRCTCAFGGSATRAPEATSAQRVKNNYLGQASWRRPISARVFLDVGTLIIRYDSPFYRVLDVTRDDISVTELSRGVVFGAAPSYSHPIQNENKARADLSYVTGAHAVKVGVSLENATSTSTTEVNGEMTYSLLNGVPRQVTVFAPVANRANLNALVGLYAQDQWAIKRLTVNAGLRFMYQNAGVPALRVPAGRFVPERSFPAVTNIPNWKDLTPRLGAAYDLFGDGKTAIKVTASRYVNQNKLDLTQANSPVTASVTSATRTWADVNGDFIPQENELGPLSNNRFGTVNITTRYDPAIVTGWGVRPYNWEVSTALNHELLPQVSVNAGYFRRWFGNFTVTDNLEVTPADYDPYCLSAPVDSRLPGGGGNQICGLYDLNPSKFGRVDNLVTLSSKYGKESKVYNGVDLAMNARLPHGVIVSGGMSTGTTSVHGNEVTTGTDRCFVVDSPGQSRFCRVQTPWQTQVKFIGIVPLPWGLQASGSMQSNPGPPITATYTAVSAEVRNSLTRNLSSGLARVDLIEPGTLFAPRFYQVDARFAKNFRVKRIRFQGNVDLYNALNSSAVLQLNTTYGPNWQRPTYVLPGRMTKVGFQVEF